MTIVMFSTGLSKITILGIPKKYFSLDILYEGCYIGTIMLQIDNFFNTLLFSLIVYMEDNDKVILW